MKTINKIITVLGCLVMVNLSCSFATQQDMNNNNNLKRIATYSYGIGIATVFACGADYLIERTESKSNLASVGFGLTLLSDMILTELRNNQSTSRSEQLLKQESADYESVRLMLNITSVYSIYSLSRNPKILSGPLLFGLFAFGNGMYSKDKGVAGIYCLSGALINQLLPSTWDQNSVFLANVVLYLLIDQLYPKDSIGVEQKTNEGKHFSIKENRWIKD